MTKEGIQILMTSVCIPIAVYLYYRPKLNLFFKLLLFTFILSATSEILAELSNIYYKTNLYVYLAYVVINSLTISAMWYTLESYSKQEKNIICLIGFLLSLITIGVIITQSMLDTIYILMNVSVLLHLCFALQFFYHKIKNLDYKSKLLYDPYLIVALAFIIHALSTSVIMAARTIFPREYQMDILFVRQLFYLVYYLICSLAIYILHINQKRL